MNVKVGQKFKLQFPHLMQTVTVTATVVNVNEEGLITFRVPEKCLHIPFPPLHCNGKPTRYGKIASDKIPQKAFC
jgi:hypothetical protein